MKNILLFFLAISCLHLNASEPEIFKLHIINQRQTTTMRFCNGITIEPNTEIIKKINQNQYSKCIKYLSNKVDEWDSLIQLTSNPIHFIWENKRSNDTPFSANIILCLFNCSPNNYSGTLKITFYDGHILNSQDQLKINDLHSVFISNSSIFNQ